MKYDVVRQNDSRLLTPLNNAGCIVVDAGCTDFACVNVDVCFNLFCSDIVVVFPVCAPPIDSCPGTGPSETCIIAGPQSSL